MDETVFYVRVTEVIKISWEKERNNNNYVRENNLICIQTSCDTQTPFSN